MHYGHFDDEHREYVITNPDTPQPWTNYLGSTEYGAIITNNAAGYSFVGSGYGNRLLRARLNAMPATMPGRFIYLRDRDSGDYWSNSWLPVAKPLDSFKSTCRHGTAYTIISSEYAGIETEVNYFVPLGKLHEIWACTITNRGAKPRTLSLFTYAELTNHPHAGQDMDNLQYSSFISRTRCEGNVLVQSINEYQSEIGTVSLQGGGDVAGPGIYRFFGIVGAKVCGFDGSREGFLGANRGYHNPIAVERGACGGTLSFAGNSAGCLQVDLDSKPGEQTTVLVVMGEGDRVVADTVMKPYAADPQLWRGRLAEVRDHWHRRLERFQVNTPDPHFNSMVNTWNAYQCFITFNWSRAASIIYTGERNGLGYRDTVQDIQAIAHMEPGNALARLRVMLSGQISATGGAIPTVRFDHVPGRLLPGENSPRYRCDDTLWLFPSVKYTVDETGDTAFLMEQVPYADTGSASVYEHLRRALQFNLDRRGEHGLVLGLEADWNDCIRLGHNGETVFASFQLVWALDIWAGFSRVLGKADDVSWADTQRAELVDSLQKNAWENDQFVRAFSSADGYVVGSKKNDEGKCFLNAQAWAVISGAVDSAQGMKAMDTMHELLSTEFGVMICHPGFRVYGLPVMRAVLSPAGVKENAGVFSHPQGWAILAEALLGRGNRAWEYYNNCSPARMNDHAELRQIEPYVHGQFTEGVESPNHGRSRNPWLTGTATTVQVAAVRGILGMRPETDGLRIDPSIPDTWSGFTIRREFRGRQLEISVKNPSHVQHGVKSVILNGKAVDGNLVPADQLAKQGVNRVEVAMG